MLVNKIDMFLTTFLHKKMESEEFFIMIDQETGYDFQRFSELHLYSTHLEYFWYKV